VRNGKTVFLLKESAKPVANRQKRRKIQIFADPPLRQQQQQQPEEQKQEEGADQEMQGEQPQANHGMNSRRQKRDGQVK